MENNAFTERRPESPDSIILVGVHTRFHSSDQHKSETDTTNSLSTLHTKTPRPKSFPTINKTMTTQPKPQSSQAPDPEKIALINQLRRCHHEHTFLSKRLSNITQYNETLTSNYPSQYSNTAAQEAQFQFENYVFRKDTSDSFFEWYGRAHSKRTMEQWIKDVKEEIEDLKKLIEIWRGENMRIRRGRMIFSPTRRMLGVRIAVVRVAGTQRASDGLEDGVVRRG